MKYCQALTEKIVPTELFGTNKTNYRPLLLVYLYVFLKTLRSLSSAKNNLLLISMISRFVRSILPGLHNAPYGGAIIQGKIDTNLLANIIFHESMMKWKTLGNCRLAINCGQRYLLALLKIPLVKELIFGSNQLHRI